MRIIDLFSGCGGLSLGFENAGFEVIAAYENWDKAVEIYKQNFNHPIYEYDLSNVEDYSVFKDKNPDMIVGGPPCQDYSSAGKRKEGDNANLTTDFADIVVNVKPMYFLMENVDQIEKYEVYKKTVKMFSEAGYGLSSKVLNASYCGVPQARKRFFLFGELGGKDNAFLPFLEHNLSDKPMTVRDYLGNELGLKHYYRHPRNYNRRGVFSIDEPAPTIRGVNRPVPDGYKGHPRDTHNHKEVRALTTKERSILQTFPRDFILEGAKTHLEQMIGNAVPVKLAEYVASAVMQYINTNGSVTKFKRGLGCNKVHHEQIDLFEVIGS